MLDPKFIIQNIDVVRVMLEQRGAKVDLTPLLDLDLQRKSLQKEYDELRALQNNASQEIARLKKSSQDTTATIDSMHSIAQRIKEITPQLAQVDEALIRFLLYLPNMPHSSVPVGGSAEENHIVRTVGTPRIFDFAAKGHEELGVQKGIIDFDRAAKISGARFCLLSGAGARLERALINFMLDIHTKRHGYREVLPPFMVNADAMTGTGQLPKFEEDLFKTTAGYYLIPTAEVPVTNIFANEILSEKDLPICFTAYTPCFRSEAGSYGKDTKGLIRQHQFNKVELVKFSHPDHSYDELEKLTLDAESILKELEIPYRVMALCTGDMGFGAAKTYDIEVWLPGQKNTDGSMGCYREISSCSNYEEFQARRAKIRFKDGSGKNCFVHTLNGSGLAVGRTLIAVMENYQNKDGSITIPKALQPYMDDTTLI